ncbi:MAG: CAP domain-containing protein [Acidobacteriota bacterium]
MKFFPVVLLVTIFAFTASAQRSTMTASSTAVYSGTERPRVISRAPVETSANALLTAERRTFDLINQQREKHGLQSLNWSDDAARLARLHSRNMAEKNFFSHRGLDGSMVNDRAEQIGIFDWRAIGENIAFNRGYDQPIDIAVEKWLESPSHRENLLNKQWIETGVGIAVARDGSYYFTQVFILRK